MVAVCLLGLPGAGGSVVRQAGPPAVTPGGGDPARQADALRQAGHYAASARLCRRALHALPSHAAADARRAALLEVLGESLRQSFEAAPAAAALQAALEIYERLEPRPHAALGRARQRLASVRLQQNRLADADADVTRALAALAAVAGPALERAEVYDTAGDIAWARRRRDVADDWYARAVREAEAVPGGPHLVLALSLRNRANSALFLGRAAEAAEAGKRAFDLAIRILPDRHPELTGYFNDAANLAWAQGDLSTARRHWESAMRLLPAGHPEIATVLGNLALLARDLGDPDTAVSLKRRAVGLLRQQRADRDALARGYAELGRFLLSAHRYRDAEAAFGRALRILPAAAPPSQADVDRIYVDLARVALSTGDVAAAERHLARVTADASEEDTVEFDHLVARSARAALAWAKGDLDRAGAGYAALATDYARRFGPGDWNVADAKTRLAGIRLAQGDTAEASTLGREAEGIVRDHLRFTLRDLSERLALARAATRPESLDVVLSAVLAAPERGLDASAVTEVVRSRSQVLDELVERRRPRGDVTADEARLRSRHQAARSQWANLAIRGPGADPVQAARHRNALAAAREAVEAAERALGGESADVRRARERQDPGIDDIRAALPDGAALVSFVRFARHQPQPASAGGARRAPPAPIPSYVAVVTSRTSAPRLIDLGAAATLDRLVTAWRHEAAHGITAAGRTARQAERTYRAAGAALRVRIWDPIASSVAGATRILIVPDGALHVVGFASLPAEGDRYLADGAIAFHYLTTERDVLRPAAPAPDRRALLAVGGVEFGATPASAPPATASPSTAADATRSVRTPDLLRLPLNAGGCVGLDEVEFPALPATAQEAREIEQMWRGTGGEVVRLSGRQARERRVRELAPRHAVLHFATHGFFLDSSCAPPAAGGTRSVRTRLRPGDAASSNREAPPAPAAGRRPVNPLALSGLAFANANRRADTTRGEDDGVLTAEEVASLDLQGVEWVVLSACDTGLGPIRAREGVLGLRRAFEIAGARTVIMSLWSVEDRATRLWMRELYRSRTQRRRDTIDSLGDANRALLQARRAAGATTHPYFWAGFVATGDWR